jgi:hypothetical protein
VLEMPFLTNEDEERVENGGVNRKKWSWEREEGKKQVSSSLPEGRVQSSKSKSKSKSKQNRKKTKEV